jgi:DNA-binding PadR family transcriptional regulator
MGSLVPQHAYGIAARLEQIAPGPFWLNQGTLYPALVRLEQKGWIRGNWQTTKNNREAKYYAITCLEPARSRTRWSVGRDPRVL